MAKKYVNFRVGGVPERKDEDYTVWTNDLLSNLLQVKLLLTLAEVHMVIDF